MRSRRQNITTAVWFCDKSGYCGLTCCCYLSVLEGIKLTYNGAIKPMPLLPVVMVACLPNVSADSTKLDMTICQTYITVILTANYHHSTLHQSVTHFRFQRWQLLSSEMWRHVVMQKLTEVSDKNFLSLQCILICVRLPVPCLSYPPSNKHHRE
jgi:hypothetical protein